MPSSRGRALQKAFLKRCPMAHSVFDLFDFVPQVNFYVKDEQSRFVRANVAFIANHAVENEDQVLGRTDHDFHPPVMAQAYVAEDRRVMRSGRALGGQIWMVLYARREPRWYVSSKTPLFDPAGQVVGLAGAMYRIEQPQELSRYFQELTPVVQHIEQHFAEPVSMTRMAALAGCSPTHFNRRFQQLLRMTPTQYLTQVRVQEARRLLTTTHRTLTAIAHEVGYCDQSHLTKRFHRATGMTPAAYRRQFRSM